jgi:hypothetical protein
VRRPLRASLVTGLLAVTLAGCATENRVNLPGYDPTVAEVDAIGAVALFLVVPLVISLLIAALVWLPGMVRGSRYRPGGGWAAAPVWFAGPPDPAAAVETAETGDMTRGGASGSW